MLLKAFLLLLQTNNRFGFTATDYDKSNNNGWLGRIYRLIRKIHCQQTHRAMAIFTISNWHSLGESGRMLAYWHTDRNISAEQYPVTKHEHTSHHRLLRRVHHILNFFQRIPDTFAITPFCILCCIHLGKHNIRHSYGMAWQNHITLKTNT